RLVQPGDDLGVRRPLQRAGLQHPDQRAARRRPCGVVPAVGRGRLGDQPRRRGRGLHQRPDRRDDGLDGRPATRPDGRRGDRVRGRHVVPARGAAVRQHHRRRRPGDPGGGPARAAGGGLPVHHLLHLDRRDGEVVPGHRLHADADLGGPEPGDAGVLHREPELPDRGRPAPADQAPGCCPPPGPRRGPDHRRRLRAGLDRRRGPAAGPRRRGHRTDGGRRADRAAAAGNRGAGSGYPGGLLL
ncbi:MAG: Glycerol-3-phosphate ABC transporter, periplasmic glycerol-3-phosphate-binding protein, partial [uncultured Thermomicrobiales bacterium]